MPSVSNKLCSEEDLEFMNSSVYSIVKMLFDSERNSCNSLSRSKVYSNPKWATDLSYLILAYSCFGKNNYLNRYSDFDDISSVYHKQT